MEGENVGVVAPTALIETPATSGRCTVSSISVVSLLVGSKCC